MEKKDPSLEKRSALSGNDEDMRDLENLEDEEVAQAVEGLKVDRHSSGGTPSIVHDAKVEAEIKEMFRDIVSQYITPVGKSIRALVNGDISNQNLEICVGALKPLILACEEIHYNDIYDALKSIEQPLIAFRDGKKKLLSKKDIRNITTDYKELMRLISRSVGTEMLETNSTGSVRVTSATGNLIYNNNPNRELHIADALTFFTEVDPGDIQRLYAAGLIKLGLIAEATAQEISESTGLTVAEAERMKHCAYKAISTLPIPKAATTEKFPDPTSAPTFRYDEEPEASEFITTTKGKDRWLTALDAISSEGSNYLQMANNLISELERTHRAVVRLRIARERFNGEMEFYQDDLAEMLDSDEQLSAEFGNASNAQRQILRHLQQIIDTTHSALKKTDLIHSQIADIGENLQDIEAELIILRRRKAAITKVNAARRREEQAEAQPSKPPRP